MLDASTEQSGISAILDTPLLSANRFRLERDRKYLIKGLLLASQVSVLYGPPNTGKSAIIACLGAHVAMGKNCGDLRVRRAPVLYVAAEDPTGIAERASPHLATDPLTAAAFDILPRAINLTDSDQITRFIREVRDYQQRSGTNALLLVIDTLNLCIGDGDENSATTMGKVIGNAQRIARQTSAHVLIVHHTSAGDKSRPRGSTALEGNVDTLLMLRQAEGDYPNPVVALTMEKQRSVRKAGPIAFEITPFDAGLDSEGDPLTVPMAQPYEPSAPLFSRSSPGAGPRNAVGSDPRVADIVEALHRLERVQPGSWHEPKLIGQQVGSAFAEVQENPDSLRKAVKRTLDAVAASGRALTDGAGRFRAVPGPSTTPTADRPH